MKLLMLCLGNICRSPMAEGALRARLQSAGLAGVVQVDSAGTGGWHAGESPDPRAVACAFRHQVDLTGLRARQLRSQDFDDFDWILCADKANLHDAERYAGDGRKNKLVLLLEWAGLGSGREVPDPYYGGAEDFEQTWQLVDAAAESIIARLLENQ